MRFWRDLSVLRTSYAWNAQQTSMLAFEMKKFQQKSCDFGWLHFCIQTEWESKWVNERVSEWVSKALKAKENDLKTKRINKWFNENSIILF